MLNRLASIAIIAGLATAAPAFAQTTPMSTVDIKEWKVEWENSRPRDPFAVSANEVWFVGQQSHYMAKLDVASGKMTKVDIPGAGPHNLIVDSTGVVWYAGNLQAHIGRYDPKTGKVEKIDMPDPAARDPHTLLEDGKGNIWFTVQGGNMMGRLNMATKKVDLIKSKTERSRPYGIKIAPDGKPWVVLFGTNKLASIDPATLALTEIDIPRASARPRRVEITTDGRIWYCDYADGKLGVYDPKTKAFTEWDMPSGAASRPYGMATDDRDRIWLVESGVQPNKFVGFDTKAGKFFSSTAIPSGGGTVRHMHYLKPAQEVWFGADTNTIGRAKVG
jgi:virginiamycin B lyase